MNETKKYLIIKMSDRYIIKAVFGYLYSFFFLFLIVNLNPSPLALLTKKAY